MIHTFLATSAIHLKYKLKITPEEALQQAVDGGDARPDVRATRSSSRPRTPRAPTTATCSEVLQAVHEAGATTLNVPDTVGYALPDEYARAWCASSCATSRAP